MSTPIAEAPDTTASAAPVRRRRVAPLIAIPVAVVMVLLVVLLATRDPATERLAKSPLVGKQAPPGRGRHVEERTIHASIAFAASGWSSISSVRGVRRAYRNTQNW